jgi:hypothetical protein
VEATSTARPRLQHQGEGGPGVDGQQLLQPLGGVVLEGRAAQGEAGVVHQDVQPPERRRGRPHRAQRSTLGGEVRQIGDGLAASGADGGHGLFGRRGVGALAEQSHAHVGHHHPGAAPGQQQGVLAAHAAAGPGDQGDAAVEPQLGHGGEGRYCAASAVWWARTKPS